MRRTPVLRIAGTSINIALQEMMYRDVDIYSAIYSGFAISPGGFAAIKVELKSVEAGLFSGMIGAPVTLAGNLVMFKNK